MTITWPGHPADLLVTIPRNKGWIDVLTGSSVTRLVACDPAVPMLTLYDDGRSDSLFSLKTCQTWTTPYNLLNTRSIMYKLLLLTDFSSASQHAIAYTQALFADNCG